MAQSAPGALLGAILILAAACGQTSREAERGATGGEPPGSSGAGTTGGTAGDGGSPVLGGSGGQLGTGGAGTGGTSTGGTGGVTQCLPRDDDPTGYLVKICEYLIARDDVFVDVDPNQYHIESIETRTEDGREVLWVHLDCCYMGDIAFIDPETGEVIGFSVGDV